jgi:endonuclease YncB( thermonuclease family)
MGGFISCCKSNQINRNINIADQTTYDLLNATYQNTQEFTLKGMKCWAKCVKVYDGDTIHLALNIDGNIRRIKCRLAEIDTAEIRSNEKSEKDFAEKAKNRMIELINQNKLIWIHINGIDKYGRNLVTIYMDIDESKSINQLMIDEGLAYKYDGGTKMIYRNGRFGAI